MDRIEKETRKKARKARIKEQSAKNSINKPNSSNKIIFLKTFLIAFCLILVIAIPVITLATGIGNINPFGSDNIVLADELDIETLIPSDSPFYDAFTESERVNVLMLGVNTGLTDTIMLVSFDIKSKHVDIISIPRDTYYHRDGFNSEAENKINASYKRNPVNTARAVSEVLLGMPINYYVVVEYDDIVKIVDTMGGVPMNIEFNMKYKDPYDTPPLNINIPAGQQILDGKTSVEFLRYRKGYAEGDLGRVKAQQQFMKNAFKQCLSFDILKIMKVGFQEVDSDITWSVALGLATKAVGMSGDEITTYTMPGYADPDPPYYVFPQTKKIEEMVTEIYSIKPDTTTDGAVVSD